VLFHAAGQIAQAGPVELLVRPARPVGAEHRRFRRQAAGQFGLEERG
jgi:hypothetical protein